MAQGRAGANTTVSVTGGPLDLSQPGVFQNPDGSLFRIPLTDGLRFVNQPTGDLPQARDISNAIFVQPKDANGDDISSPSPVGFNDFGMFFGQALTHDMVETFVNVSAVTIPASTGIGWAGGQVDPATGEPTAAFLVRVNPQTGQALCDAQGQLVRLTQEQIDALDTGTAVLPAINTVNQQEQPVTIPAVTQASQLAAWDAVVNHQALSLGAPFALQRAPGVYDDEDVRQQANTETAFLDLSNVYGKATTATVAADSIGDSGYITRVGDVFTDAAGVRMQRIEIDTSEVLRRVDANGETPAFLLTSDEVSGGVRQGDNLLPTYR